ncbi:hypothetical protein [uncultured Pontibacter sp.]|uniref:hypothetical protein n=1 Tax=uncultured Pontibacter sp. TaxID=453356 RepID=UPI00345531B5
MSQVKGKNTKPEMKIRSMLHSLGYRFRIHNNKLPGKLDITLVRHKKIIFVHGCFKHGHNCANGKRPVTRVEF